MTGSFRGSVLVVEESGAEREALLALLRREGHRAAGVGDVTSALLARDDDEGAVDVVLCDLKLGTSPQTGVDLLRKWKQRRPSTPFIFVTGVQDVPQVVEAVKLGAEDYIVKPYKGADLLQRVQECLDAARGAAASHEMDECPESVEHGFDMPAHLSMDEIERLAIECALRRAGGNRTHAAEALQISVRTLQRKLKAWSGKSGVGVRLGLGGRVDGA